MQDGDDDPTICKLEEMFGTLQRQQAQAEDRLKDLEILCYFSRFWLMRRYYIWKIRRMSARINQCIEFQVSLRNHQITRTRSLVAEMKDDQPYFSAQS
jgi:hypothetical protein